jgi:phosphoribosylformylglycinamidine cyclo-ligase
VKSTTYESAGVSISKGDAFAEYIARYPSKAIGSGLGGFAGGIELDIQKYKQPILLSCTDGVGTKLLVAQKLKKFSTLGIDLVAMCVNDLIVCGAEPQVFLDYLATGAIIESQLQDLISGIIKGCEEAECILAGGETAEMPDVYELGEFDMAGFASGIVEKSKLLPKKESMKAGDLLYGFPSSGVHSNGFSLARKVLDLSNTNTLEALLVPTKIYVKQLRPLLHNDLITGAAHITGGGLVGNIQRILPPNLKPSLTWDWKIPSIFSQIQDSGPVDLEEMRKVFNMGIGLAVVIAQEHKQLIEDFRKNEPLLSDLIPIGLLING